MTLYLAAKILARSRDSTWVGFLEPPIRSIHLLAAAMLAVVSLAPIAATAQDDAGIKYIYVQIGPTFGIVDDSFEGDYEDTVGLNGRLGFRRDWLAFELHVEGLPGSIVKRGKNSKKVGEDIVSFTANLKLFYDVGPFEIYGVAGVGMVSLTEVFFLALSDEDGEFEVEIEDKEETFHVRAGFGVQFPIAPHLYGFVEGAWNGGGDAIERYSYLSLTTGIGFRF